MSQLAFDGWKPFFRSTRPRPKRSDDDIELQAAKELCRRLIKRVPDLSEDNFEEMCDDILDAIAYETDGYKIARELESHGWDVDDEIVDVMREASFVRNDVLDRAVKLWAADAQAEPQFEVGATVRFSHRGQEVEGVVVKLDLQRAQYIVQCASLGHVASGVGVHGIVANFEDVFEVAEK